MKLTRLQKLQAVLLILTVLLIFTQSLMPPHVSSSESGFITQLLYPILARILPSGVDMEHFVRKAGHFSEYFLLGLQLGLFRLSPPKPGSFRLQGFLCLGGMVWMMAFLDETLQIFSGRGPMIQDVWLDLAGGLTGLMAAALLRLLFQKKNNKNAPAD